jgi:cyclic pyranopterin phosphate synthase
MNENPSVSSKNNLIDRFGRVISYLRVSLTENCNLRCNYCYGSLSERIERSDYLTDDELLTLIKVLAALGIEKIRFTGGEPLIKKNLSDLIGEISAIENISQIAVTTNGLLLENRLAALIGAGLNRLNVSLDTLKRDKFRNITGIDGFDRVNRGIMKAVESGVFPAVKVNTVVMRGINDDEITAFAEWALTNKINLRFIEFMPTCKSGWGKERVLYEEEIKNRIGLPLRKAPDFDQARGPARNYYLPGKSGRISFISPVSGSFCGDCNRIRMTATGDLIGCLFGRIKINLRQLVRDDHDQNEIILLLKSIIASPDFRKLSLKQSVSGTPPFMRGIGG